MKHFSYKNPIFILAVLCSCFVFAGNQKTSFGFNSGYIDAVFTKETEIYPSLEAALKSPDSVKAVIISATSKCLADIKKLKKLKFLYLDNTFTDNSFYLSKEGTETFFIIFGGLPELEYISIYDSKLLPYLKHLKLLKGLKIMKFDWNIFQSSVKSFEQLELLIIDDPQVTQLPNALGQLLSLKQLEIYATNITELPEMTLLQNLVVFRSMFGKITDLHETFAALENLKYLEIKGMVNFKKFPVGICNLKNLCELYIELRNATPLPDSIGNLTNLKILHLYDCQKIYKIPQTITKMSELEEICLSDAYYTIDVISLTLIDHPFTLILINCDYERIAKQLATAINLKELVIPSATLPKIVSEIEKVFPKEKIIKKEI